MNKGQGVFFFGSVGKSCNGRKRGGGEQEEEGGGSTGQTGKFQFVL